MDNKGQGSMGLLIGLAMLGIACSGEAGVYTLKSGELEVQLDPAFPRVISYRHLESAAVIHGQPGAASELMINGEIYTPRVESKKPGKILNRSTARYELEVERDGAEVEVDVEISLKGSVLTYRITEVEDDEGFLVNTIEIPDNAMISVESSQPGAALSAAIIHADKSKQMDDFIEITSTTAATNWNAAYAILNTDQLAATLVNNSAYDIDKNDPRPKGTKRDKSIQLGNGRVRVAIENEEGKASAGLSNGKWTYRARKSDITADELWCKVIITTDRNHDGGVDWQDGAIAYRDIMDNPYKAEKTKKRVAQHISFNFGSAAGEPFLRALDNVKRVHYATDGLGQFLLLKGYQSEGHDSSHPDYGGNIGIRQGGKAEMNMLVDVGQEWNAEVGVHINCQEAYPEAYTFEPDMVYTNRRGWNWIDQSYIMNHRRDITSGALEKRVRHMMDEVPGLDFIYMDVYWGDGWLSQEMARILERAGVGITTEFPHMLEHAATWSHWSTDITYGPDRLRGINSHIIRFIRNHQKDMYLQHPLLGHAELGDFEGWQGRTDFNQFLGKLYSAALPSKYLQHFKIMKWTEHEVLLGEDVRITDEAGRRQIFRGGRKILDGSVYLLPWEPDTEEKLYHWSGLDLVSTWELPPGWNTEEAKLYQLTDTGRSFIADLPVKDGRVTITAKSNTPYVVYPGEAPALPKPNWGEGSVVSDPGFCDSTLAAWHVKAGDGVVSVVTDEHRRTALTIGESTKPASVSQDLELEPGTYAASVWVEVDVAGRKASLVMTPGDGTTSEVWTDNSPLLNTVKCSNWNRTRSQWMRVVFDVPKGAKGTTIELAAAPGTSIVRFDNIRVVPTTRCEKDGYDFYEDFEDNDEGWFPFVKGLAGNVEDPRTHLSERHEPYTQKGWNGKLVDDVIEGDWSLKSHSERLGRIWRTVPQTLRFEPGGKYEVSFDYQCAYDEQYDFLIGNDEGNDGKVVERIPFKKAAATRRFTVVVEPKEMQSVWIGAERMKKNEKGVREVDLVIDNLGVRRLDK
jgi:endo-alpha-N-acetylgalactosaminidase